MTFLERVFNHTSSARENTHTPAPTANRTYSYAECVMGIAPVPHDCFGGSVFKLLMASGMTTVMVTFNSLVHSGASFVLDSLWLYPLILCLSLGMRFLYADRIVERISPRYILPRFRGFARNLATTLLNIALMAPVMGFLAALLLVGPDGCLDRMASTLPYSIPVSILVNLLVVGPIVKMLYHNVLTASAETKIFELTQRCTTTWAGVFTC